MKTSKIVISIAALNLVLFMSVSSIANPFTNNTGDIVTKSAKKQIEVVKSTTIETASTSENEFSHLRFDVNKFNTESGATELPLNSLDYLRFEASDFDLTSELSEMPVNDFGFLRFDVNRFSAENASSIEELPESR